MAWLILTDERRVQVSYDTAAKVYQILTGNKRIEPDKSDQFKTRKAFVASDEYKKKKEFLSTVVEVEFDDKKSNGPRPWEKWIKQKRLDI